MAFTMTPIRGLIVFCVALFMYPQRLVVELGPLNFTLGRIVILALLANAIFRAKLTRKLQLNALDFLFLLVFFCITGAAFTTMPAGGVVVRQGGLFMDTMFPYFAVRMILKSKEDLIAFIKGVAIIGVPLSILGIYEAITGRNPVDALNPYYGMGFAADVESIADKMEGGTNGKRFGLFRATGTFGIHICFGLFFAALAPMIAGLWKQPRANKVLIAAGVGFMLVGILSSASTAPLFSIVVSVAMIFCYPYRRFWPVLAISIFLSLLFVEVYSNRHFYHVITRLALNQETAYYRIGLFDQTFQGGMDGHWFTGYGYVGLGPGTDNSNFPFFYKDLVNIYLYYLVRYGLMGVLPFIALNIVYYRKTYLGGVRASATGDKWLVWCFGAALVGWNVAMMTVGALSQNEILMAMMLGIASNLELIMAAESRVPANASQGESSVARGRFMSRVRGPWQSRFQTRVRQQKVRRRAA